MLARDNPFSTDRVLKVRYRPLETTWPALLEKLDSLSYRAAIVGPKGAGKTTLLEDLEPHLVARGFQMRRLRLDLSKPRFFDGELDVDLAQMSQRDIVLFDGASHLSRLRWWMFRKKCAAAGGLIVTSHRPGLLPTLIDCKTTPELLEEIVRKLLGDRADGLGVSMESLHLRHRGNIREALRSLYDRHAGINPPQA